MTIAENLNRILEAKADIKAAIENKGVDVGDAKIDEYAAKIDEIEGGGKMVLPVGTCFGNSTFKVFDTTLIDVSNLTNTSSMFRSCSNLENLDLTDWDMSNVTSLQGMFASCSKITTIGDVSNWRTSKVTNMSDFCYSCGKLVSIDMTNWDVGKVTTLYDSFGNAGSLTSVGDLSNWNLSSCNSLKTAFRGTKVSTFGDISNWNVSKVTAFDGVFQNCVNLVDLDLSGWDFSAGTSLANIFGGCTNLTNLSMGYNIKKSFSISDCKNLTKESLLSVINGLYDYSSGSTTYTLTIGTTNLAKLSDEEKAIATAKKWILA